MEKILNVARRFREEEDGAAMVEYSILVGIISAAAIIAVLAIGGYVKTAFEGLCTNLNGNGGTCTLGGGAGGG
ncbi:Flp family type IVb pilin [Pseudaminobacter soli (ex Li et al. 2025)]|uniref:Flp family type IVb pilin n=1 Tax=Pseudaminobacter soli (ex Li et al. 2025) TaxID=1295366 RepID=A0A2P7RZZ8_9HYPH|nr:Flp family type IVb pilin [Mesorhizobium soli]PSJ55817.1 Flp family type IVb pilin [Mesorhizobium soli]